MTTFPREKSQQGRKESPTKPRAFSIYEKDYELIRWLASEMGCSNSEAVRTAVRSFAASMQKVSLLRSADPPVD